MLSYGILQKSVQVDIFFGLSAERHHGDDSHISRQGASRTRRPCTIATILRASKIDPKFAIPFELEFTAIHLS